MHLTPMLTALLFAGLAYGQVNGVPSNGPNTVAAVSFVQSEFSALVSAGLPASLSADSTLSPNNDQANCGASASGTDTSAFNLGAIATALVSVWDSGCVGGATAATSGPQKTTSATTTPSAVNNPNSSTSTTTSGSGSAGASSETSGVSKSTTVNLTSGTSTLSTTSAKTPTVSSASPTESKKSVASQMRGFTGGAGILLLLGMLAGL